MRTDVNVDVTYNTPMLANRSQLKRMASYWNVMPVLGETSTSIRMRCAAKLSGRPIPRPKVGFFLKIWDWLVVMVARYQ